RDAEQVSDLLEGDSHPLSDLVDPRFSPQVLDQFAPGALELVDRLAHVNRKAHGAVPVCNASGDGLANPPCGVENLKPLEGSNFSTPRMRPRLPSWITSRGLLSAATTPLFLKQCRRAGGDPT